MLANWTDNISSAFQISPWWKAKPFFELAKKSLKKSSARILAYFSIMGMSWNQCRASSFWRLYELAIATLIYPNFPSIFQLFSSRFIGDQHLRNLGWYLLGIRYPLLWPLNGDGKSSIYFFDLVCKGFRHRNYGWISLPWHHQFY